MNKMSYKAQNIELLKTLKMMLELHKNKLIDFNDYGFHTDQDIIDHVENVIKKVENKAQVLDESPDK